MNKVILRYFNENQDEENDSRVSPICVIVPEATIEDAQALYNEINK